jgi:hypothetical protein
MVFELFEITQIILLEKKELDSEKYYEIKKQKFH